MGFARSARFLKSVRESIWKSFCRIFVLLSARKTEDWTDRSNPHLVIGRLRSGTTIESAHSELTTIFQRLKEEQPASIAQTEVGALITPYRERVIGNTRAPLLLLAGVVGCVLLIACANVANLLFARAMRATRVDLTTVLRQ